MSPYDGHLATQGSPVECVITYVSSYNQKDNIVVFGFEITAE
jgi:hypothetical protein